MEQKTKVFRCRLALGAVAQVDHPSSHSDLITKLEAIDFPAAGHMGCPIDIKLIDVGGAPRNVHTIMPMVERKMIQRPAVLENVALAWHDTLKDQGINTSLDTVLGIYFIYRRRDGIETDSRYWPMTMFDNNINHIIANVTGSDYLPTIVLVFKLDAWKNSKYIQTGEIVFQDEPFQKASALGFPPQLTGYIHAEIQDIQQQREISELASRVTALEIENNTTRTEAPRTSSPSYEDVVNENSLLRTQLGRLAKVATNTHKNDSEGPNDDDMSDDDTDEEIRTLNDQLYKSRKENQGMKTQLHTAMRQKNKAEFKQRVAEENNRIANRRTWKLQQSSHGNPGVDQEEYVELQANETNIDAMVAQSMLKYNDPEGRDPTFGFSLTNSFATWTKEKAAKLITIQNRLDHCVKVGLLSYQDHNGTPGIFAGTLVRRLLDGRDYYNSLTASLYKELGIRVRTHGSGFTFSWSKTKARMRPRRSSGCLSSTPIDDDTMTD